MSIRRRGLLLGLLAAPLVVKAESIMRVVPYVPKLWGDGIHDDTAALQWRLDVDGRLELRGGIYRVTDTIRLPYGATSEIIGARFEAAEVAHGHRTPALMYLGPQPGEESHQAPRHLLVNSIIRTEEYLNQVERIAL